MRQLSPSTPEVHAKLGVIYFQQGKFSQAVPALSQALKLKPGLPNADFLLAMSLSELGRFTEALPGLERAFRKSAEPAMKRMAGLQLTRAYTGLQRDDKAVEVSLELKRLYPNDPEVLYHAGRLFGNFAYLTMRKLADVAPESVWRHQASAEVHESQEAYDCGNCRISKKCSQWIRGVQASTSASVGPRWPAHANQKLAAEETGQAIKEFEQELQLDPTNANAAYEMGEIYRKSAAVRKGVRILRSRLEALSRFRRRPHRPWAGSAGSRQAGTGSSSPSESGRSEPGERRGVLLAGTGVSRARQCRRNSRRRLRSSGGFAKKTPPRSPGIRSAKSRSRKSTPAPAKRPRAGSRRPAIPQTRVLATARSVSFG